MANRAVVVGSAHYGPESLIPSHETIDASVDGYTAAIEANPLWGKGSCLPLKDPQTITEIWQRLDEAMSVVTKDDILLMVYVGHGAYWYDVPGGEVHFALASSVKDEPTTWLNAWHLYYKLRTAKAGLKVLIADCCYSNLLRSLGDHHNTVPGVVLRSQLRGTAVITALGGGAGDDQQFDASPDACTKLDEPWSNYTLFSGHLLKILTGGVVGEPELTLGGLRDAVESEMIRCGGHTGRIPQMVATNSAEKQPIFQNPMPPDERSKRRQLPADGNIPGWVDVLSLERDVDVNPLLAASPRHTGEVERELRRLGGEIRMWNARRISQEADRRFDPTQFVQYQNQLEMASQA